MTIGEMMCRDMLNAINDAPVTAWFNGLEVLGTLGSLVESSRLVEGGILEEPDLTFSTTLEKLEGDSFVSRLDVWPEVGDKLTFDNVDYRVERKTTDEFSSAVSFDLMGPNK